MHVPLSNVQLIVNLLVCILCLAELVASNFGKPELLVGRSVVDQSICARLLGRDCHPLDAMLHDFAADPYSTILAATALLIEALFCRAGREFDARDWANFLHGKTWVVADDVVFSTLLGKELLVACDIILGALELV